MSSFTFSDLHIRLQFLPRRKREEIYKLRSRIQEMTKNPNSFFKKNKSLIYACFCHLVHNSNHHSSHVAGQCKKIAFENFVKRKRRKVRFSFKIHVSQFSIHWLRNVIAYVIFFFAKEYNFC